MIRIALHAAHVGYRDLVAQFTWRSWLFGWIARVAAQVVFFASIGLLVGGDEYIQFALIGNVGAIAAQAGLSAGPDTAWERSLGTLPLLVAAPTSLMPIFAGRSTPHILRGMAEGFLVLIITSRSLGVSVSHWLWAPVGLLVLAVGSYGVGLVIAAIALRRVHVGNVLFNAIFYTFLVIAGVNVPTDSFAEPVQKIAAGLPLHHGLIGFRSLLSSGPTSSVLRYLAFELAVGACWAAVAFAGFRSLIVGARRDGSISLVE